MEGGTSEWHPNKPDKHLKLAVEVALCHNNYHKISLKIPTTTGEYHTAMVTAVSDTGALMCLIGRCVTRQMGITSLNLTPTTKITLGANGGQIKLDGATFLHPTVNNATSSQIVYVMPQVICLFLS